MTTAQTDHGLAGRVALVTGAGRGIGRAIALALAAEAAHVALLARSQAELDAVAQEIRALGGQALVLPADVGVMTLEDAASLASHERGLVVISTLRPNGTIQSSLVNAGVLAHPATGETVLGLVTAGAVKLGNLRARPQITATFRNGWQWAAVEGHAQLAGPDDPPALA